MRLFGEWLLCDDGVTRPVIRGGVLAADGSWTQAEFLLDTGADRTVFHVGLLSSLGLEPLERAEQLGGLGGTADTVLVETTIRLTTEQAQPLSFRGESAAVTDPEALDMSVLGRDILGLFAVIVDRPGDVVCLIRPPSRYWIEPS